MTSSLHWEIHTFSLVEMLLCNTPPAVSFRRLQNLSSKNVSKFQPSRAFLLYLFLPLLFSFFSSSPSYIFILIAKILVCATITRPNRHLALHLANHHYINALFSRKPRWRLANRLPFVFIKSPTQVMSAQTRSIFIHSPHRSPTIGFVYNYNHRKIN